MLQPLLTMLVLTIVFSYVFRFDLVNYPVYALSGLLFWNFFQQGTVAAMNSLRGNAQLLTRLPVPRWIFPLATILAGLVNMALALVPLFVILIATGHPLHLSLLFLPLSILIAATFTLGVALLVSPLAVFFADVVELIGVLLTLLLYTTPVFYPAAIVPPRYYWLIRFNPLRSLLVVFRDPIYDGVLPSPAHIAASAAMAVGSLWIGALLFRRFSDRIPFHV